MKHKWILIVVAVLFFLTAVTIYVNRVVFPNIIKKIAIEQAEKFLGRKVEIETLHFSWLKGVILDHVKVYQKNSNEAIFIQAEKVSMGIIFIPGAKQHKLVIPFINIESPSVHLIRKGDEWNFADLLTPPVSAPNEKPSPIAVSVTGISMTDGKLRLDDIQSKGNWNELLDHLNLKVGLSYPGVTFDASVSIPTKNASLSVAGSYQIVSQAIKAAVNLRNIKPVDYLALLPAQLPLTLRSLNLEEVKAQVEYDSKNIAVKGNWTIKDLDMTYLNYVAKGNLQVTNADISWTNNSVLEIKGDFVLADSYLFSPEFSFTGGLKAHIDYFHMNSPDDITLKGYLESDAITLEQKEVFLLQGRLKAELANLSLQKESTDFQGNLNVNSLILQVGANQSVKGNIALKNIKANRSKDGIKATTDIQLENMEIHNAGSIYKGSVSAYGFGIQSDPKNNITLNGAIDLTQLFLTVDRNTIGGSIYLQNFNAAFDSTAQTVDSRLQGIFKDCSLQNGPQTFAANGHFDLHGMYPLKNPKALTYEGSLALDEGQLKGLPLGPVDAIHLSADIKTDTATIQSLSLNFLDTPITVSGQVINFEKPILNVEVQSSRIDLRKIKNVAPDLVKTHGLTIEGETSFKLKFEGLASDPLSGKINAEAVLKDVSVESSVLKQSFKNMSGSLQAKGDSLSWEDFTVTFMDKTATLTGYLKDFKNPHVTTSLASDNIELQLDAQKNGDMLTIYKAEGHYLSAAFETTGSVDLSQKTPTIDIKNNVKFKLEDIPGFLPQLKEQLDPLQLSGLITLNASIKGTATDWQNWTSSANVTSDLIKVQKYKFSDVSLKLEQTDGKITSSTLNSTFYGGSINALTTVDLADKNFPSDIALKFENVDMASVIKDMGLVQDIRGKFNLTSILKASLLKPLEASGKGTVAIHEAYLTDIEIFKGILTPLKSVISTSNLVITDVEGNYGVAEQKVTTDNLQLKGNLLTLLAKGNVGFDQSINMTLEVPDEYNANSPIPAEFRQGVRFSITGKLPNPKIDHHFSEVKMILNVGRKLLGESIPQGISDILNQVSF